MGRNVHILSLIFASGERSLGTGLQQMMLSRTRCRVREGAAKNLTEDM
jgi:hypothetical protein